jgi:hypothetical protein
LTVTRAVTIGGVQASVERKFTLTCLLAPPPPRELSIVPMQLVAFFGFVAAVATGNAAASVVVPVHQALVAVKAKGVTGGR